MTDERPDRTPTSEPSAKPPPEPPPATSAASTQEPVLDPRPKIKKASRTAFLAAVVVGLVVLTVLSFRYSRESLGPPPEAPEPPGPAPLGAEQLERLRPPAGPPDLPKLPELQDVQEPPPAPPPRPVPRLTPRKPRPPKGRSAPLAVSLPGRGGGGGDLAGSAASRLAEQAARFEQGSALESAQEDPAAGDPRQLASPEANAVRVELASPQTPYELKGGTYIPAVLTQTLSSEIGGLVRARVGIDLYDSASSRHVLIPRGTVALGRQTRQPLLGERRLLIAWERLLLPDGRTLALEGAPAAGADGTLGVPGQVHRHWGKRFGAAALLSVVGAGFQLAQPRASGDFGRAPDTGQVAAGAVGLELGRLSQEILRQFVNLPPTVSLEPGARVHMLLTRDLAFERPYEPGTHTAGTTH